MWWEVDFFSGEGVDFWMGKFSYSQMNLSHKHVIPRYIRYLPLNFKNCKLAFDLVNWHKSKIMLGLLKLVISIFLKYIFSYGLDKAKFKEVVEIMACVYSVN